MPKESSFQSKVIKFLKQQGCFVMKVQAGPGVPKGTADVFFCKDGFYGFIECKQTKNSKKQPGQEPFIQKMNEWSYAKFAWPGKCWDGIKAELSEMLR